MNRSLLLIVAFFFLLPSLLYGAGNLYIQSKKAKILALPKFKAAVVTTVKKGDELVLLGKKGNWYQVRIGEKAGWISKLLVSSKPPMKKVSLFSTLYRFFNKKSRRRASTVVTAGAVRGLTADDRKRASQDIHSNYAALEIMEQFSVSEEELDTFIKQGVGE